MRLKIASFLFQTLVGNLVNCSPISDMNPLLAAMGAEMEMMKMGKGERKIYAKILKGL